MHVNSDEYVGMLIQKVVCQPGSITLVPLHLCGLAWVVRCGADAIPILFLFLFFEILISLPSSHIWLVIPTF